MEPNYWLVTSSFLFVAPGILCYQLNLPVLSMIYFLVTCTSSAYHATKHPMLLWADLSLLHINHLSTVSYIVWGGLVSMPAYFAWLLYAVIVYYYGHTTSSFVWDPNRSVATFWHITLHLATSLTTLFTVYTTHCVEELRHRASIIHK